MICTPLKTQIEPLERTLNPSMLYMESPTANDTCRSIESSSVSAETVSEESTTVSSSVSRVMLSNARTLREMNVLR
jgi:hypothetical protein